MPSIGAVGQAAAPSGDVSVDRDVDGVWRYSGTSIVAVGAKDRTLADVLRVRELGIRGGEPEAVVFSLSELVKDPRLNWVLQAGIRLRGGEEDLFSIPWPVWQERSAEPVDVWLPERDARGLDRQLATTERALRFLRDALETTTARRSQLALLAIELGMTRRQIAETLGLSAGRVQQLYEDIDERHADLVRETIGDARTLLDQIDSDIHPDQLEVPRGWTREKLDDVFTHLVDFGLLEVIEGSEELQITEAGRRAIGEQITGTTSSTRRAVRSGS